MSKIWNDLKSNMKDWSNAAVEKAEEVSKVAVAKTEELTRISKVKLSIHQLYRDKNKEFHLWVNWYIITPRRQICPILLEMQSSFHMLKK